MFSLSPNPAIKENRLVWAGIENGPNVESRPETSLERIPPQPPVRSKKNEKTLNIPGSPDQEPEQPKALANAGEALDAAYGNKEGSDAIDIEAKNKEIVEAREISPELQKMSRAQIRNLERRNPELLFKVCFWKIEEDGTLSAIEDPSQLKAGDKIRFRIPEADGKNKNLEMSAGLRVLPKNIKVIEISGEKYYRVGEGNAFVDKNGKYRAVRSHENETITLLETSGEDKKKVEEISKTHGKEFAQRDVDFALDAFLGEENEELTPENVDKFVAELDNDPTASPEMRKIAHEQAKNLKDFAEIWSGFNIKNYKNKIAGIESRGSGNYSADNRGRGASDPWNKRALGRYQFTIETLRGFDVAIMNEQDIANFKNNPDLQERVMDEFTKQHINLIRRNPKVVAQIMSGKYSIEQVLAAMHLGGAGALRKVERGDLAGTDYFGTSFAKYMDKMAA